MKHVLYLAFAVQAFAADLSGIAETQLRAKADLPSKIELAARQLYGEIEEMDQAFILETFKLGSAAGIARAHAGLADCHTFGVGMARDDSSLRKLREMAAAGGDPMGTFRLGEDLWLGRGGPRDPVRGIELIRKASSLGLKRADAVLALRSIIGEGVAVDRESGLRRLHELADNDGNEIAAFFLGQYYRGEFGNKDGKKPQLARKYLLIAAEKNHAKSMVDLGEMAMQSGGGAGKLQPRQQAAEWYRKAIQRNSGEAMMKLARPGHPISGRNQLPRRRLYLPGSRLVENRSFPRKIPVGRLRRRQYPCIAPPAFRDLFRRRARS